VSFLYSLGEGDISFFKTEKDVAKRDCEITKRVEAVKGVSKGGLKVSLQFQKVAEKVIGSHLSLKGIIP